MKEAIIFLHGMVGNQSVFKKEKEKLKKQYYCISYDFYNSESLGVDHPFSLEILLEQLYDQYKKHNIKRAHICTLSFGCIIGMAFARKYPDMVISLTFIGGYCSGVPSELQTNRIQLLKEKSNFEYEEWLRKFANSVNTNKEQIPEDSEDIFVKSALLLHPNVFEKALRLQLEFDSRAALLELKMPILWVMGEYDELYKETLKDLKKYVPHVDYKEIKCAGHVAHIHQPEQFMIFFKQFLQKVNKREKILLIG